jgi:hypothetical protein
LFAQTDKPADKVSVDLEFNAVVLSADSEGVVDSMAGSDSGFNEDETKLGFSFEHEFWGATVSLKFGNGYLRLLDDETGEMLADPVLTLDELYGWVKPFGPWVTFTGGIFENTDGIADYTDDIDEYDMGVFVFGEGGGLFTEPGGIYTNPGLTNGFLTGIAAGPVTLQFLLGSNYSGESATALGNEVLGTMYQMFGQTLSPIETDERWYRLGGRLIIDAGVGTFAALFKISQWPMAIANPFQALVGDAPYPGDKINWTTFGGYFDFTAVENLGVSVGYTGFLPQNDDGDVDNVL